MGVEHLRVKVDGLLFYIHIANLSRYRLELSAMDQYSITDIFYINSFVGVKCDVRHAFFCLIRFDIQF
jgi:hypothetical protein